MTRSNGILRALFGAAVLLTLAGCGGGSASISGGSGEGGVGGGGGAVGASVTLEWEAPVARADGSPLNDLAGYRIYYGTNTGSYTSSVDIGPSTTCVIDDLATGSTYYFVVTSYDSSGNESELSNEISKDI